MNQYIFLHRMRGPIFLLTFGVTAILDEYTGIHYGQSWPLYLIVWGVLRLAENALLAQNPPAPPTPWPGYGPPTGPSYPSWSSPSAPAANESPASTAIVPAHPEEGR